MISVDHLVSSLSRLRFSRSVSIILMIVAVITLSALAMSNQSWFMQPGASHRWAAPNPLAIPAATPESVNLVRRARLRPHLREVLNVLGNRLEKAGQERLILQGNLSRTSSARREQLPVRLILEFPDRLRLEELAGNQPRVTGYDGKAVWRTGATLTTQDEDEVESLLFDSVEHFLAAQLQGVATRFLGSRFRLDDGTTVKYAGPFYDLYQTTDRATAKSAAQPPAKLYYFNSDTLLLERVSYQAVDTGARVEVQISLWHKLGDQRVPGRISRSENGEPVLTFTVNAAGFSPRANDGIFTKPQ